MQKYESRFESAPVRSFGVGRRRIKEEVNVKEIIDEIIDTNWSGSNDEQMKAVQLLKGLATSEDPLSNKFMKALDDATSSMKKEDFE